MIKVTSTCPLVHLSAPVVSGARVVTDAAARVARFRQMVAAFEAAPAFRFYDMYRTSSLVLCPVLMLVCSSTGLLCLMVTSL